MPITIRRGSFKYKDPNGSFTDIDCIKGGDYVLTEQDKADIAGMVSVTGAVSDVQVDGTSVLQNGVANLPQIASAASDANIKSGSNATAYISPDKEHQAVFYGLAKAAGDTTMSTSNNSVGTYTNEAKSKVQQMLGVGGNFRFLNSRVVVTPSNTETITLSTPSRHVFVHLRTAAQSSNITGSLGVIVYGKSNASIYDKSWTYVFPQEQKNSTFEFQLLNITDATSRSAWLKADCNLDLSAQNMMRYDILQIPSSISVDNIYGIKIYVKLSDAKFGAGTQFTVWGQ